MPRFLSTPPEARAERHRRGSENTGHGSGDAVIQHERNAESLRMANFIGLDLAWIDRNDTGICWFEGGTSDDLTCTRIGAEARNVESLADEIGAVDGLTVVAIDAPVLYTDKRWVEREIARRFGRYKASPHQAHFAVKQGRTAGIRLGEALAARGFTLDPRALLCGEHEGRVVIEVYPHTIHVRLFHLAERIPYKRKTGRSVAFRRDAMQQYQAHLRKPIATRVPRVLDNPQVEHTLSPRTAAMANGTALKRLDDTLDGLTCALAAWLVWHDPSAWELIGDLNGYIVAPRDRTEPLHA